MADSIFIATPEAGLVGTHVWDGDAWVRTLGNSAGQIMIGQEKHDDYGDGIEGLPFIGGLDEDENPSMPLIAPMLWNGTTLDRMRSTVSGVGIASAVYTATQSTALMYGYNFRGITCLLKVTANPGNDETLSFGVLHKIPTPAAYGNWAYWSAAITNANASRVVMCFPGITNVHSKATWQFDSQPLPPEFILRVTPSASGNWTYSLDYFLHY